MKRNKLQTYHARVRAAKVRTETAASIPRLSKRDVLLAGVLLYWAEGYKRPRMHDGAERTAHTISFVNADPVMIEVFIDFLIQALHIPKTNIHLAMRLYPHINEQEAFQYWMKVTGLQRSHFGKSTCLVSGASKGKRPFNRLPYGTLQVAVYKTEKFHWLMGLLEGVKKQLACVKVAALPG